MNSPKKRRRPALACLECRRRKVKCDRTTPCGQCTAHRSSCRYVGDRSSDQGLEQGQGPAGSEMPADENDAHWAGSADSVSITGGSRSSMSRTVPPGGIHGACSKTRVFGHSHWISTMPFIQNLPTCQPISPHINSRDPGPDASTGASVLTSQISEPFTRCKQLAREIKRPRPSRDALPSGLHESVPARPVLEVSIPLYFATFEPCYRILDRGEFYREYESYMQNPDPASASPSSLLKILLLLCAIAPLYPDESARRDLRANAPRWIHVAQTWLSGPLEKNRLTIDALQIHCLLLLARQTNRVGADLVWISAGSLMRMAMQMGLHQDPDSLGMEMGMGTGIGAKMDVRRRLWFTILEMNVQAALDSGMAPLVREEDYDTKIPDDEGSYQVLLARSLPLRLEATRLMNSLRGEPSYEEILRLGTQLAQVYRDATVTISSSHNQADRTQPSSSFLIHLLSRFLLCLHLPYAVQSPHNPLYTSSLQTALSASQDLLALLDDPIYRCLLIAGGGLFRDLITRAGLLIFLDLVNRVDGSSPFVQARQRARVEPLVEDARRVVSFARERLVNGDTNVKGYVGVRMVMAQVEGLLERELPGEEMGIGERVGRAAREGLEESYKILKGMAEEEGCFVGSGGGMGWDLGVDFVLDMDLDLGSEFGYWGFGFP
ncbi:hypothetical protein P170DRAFT_508533 [Aspergillus steynii IBT 23096]|uniref:Zn(2)-C6 fungal-type domain-containing protein n=1 Tax=Aspergillus steynii IBT 23096 TaxID=1392250 RepID=A0A2I2GBT3_9EURO|nr:uncharacterized protein P170DRAFT_508533 [Aspergillus steynii IBT 23096]PLB50333.1 hypothetical protein P170DRAFT_508533 [Aspergillus steynii IBT 23096]